MSFLSKIPWGAVAGAVAAPFTGGASLLPSLIGAGAAIGGSALASKLAGGNPPGYGQAQNLAAQAQQQGMNLSNQLAPQGQSLVSMAGQAYNPVINYWSSLLSGNRGAMTSALGPEISRIGQGYQTAAQTSANLNPRSGPSAAFLSELPFQQQRDVTQLMQQMRPMAAQGLQSVGQAAGQTGQGLLSNAISSLYGSTAAGRDIMQTALQKQASDRALGASIGQGIFSLFNRPYQQQQQQYGYINPQMPGSPIPNPAPSYGNIIGMGGTMPGAPTQIPWVPGDLGPFGGLGGATDVMTPPFASSPLLTLAG